jgi:Transposase DDE domain group 1
MTHFQIKQSSNLTLTSHAGLALIGQCCEAAQIEAVIDPKFQASRGMKTSDVVKSMVSLLCIGKSDYEAIEPFRDDRFFKRALNLKKVPGSVWLRQRIDKVAAKLRETTDELSMRLLTRTNAPITPDGRFVCTDMDTFVMDNSGTKKEEVGRTYQGIDGYAPIAAYLGNEGWNIGLELRPGKQHSAKEASYFLERVFPKVAKLVAPHHAILHRADSGFDSVELLFQYEHERERLAKLDRQMDYIVKWNPRREDRQAWVARASEEGAFKEVRPGKICAMLDTKIMRKFKKERRELRLITQVTLRTHDKKGQYLIEPEVELEGWWTSMEDSPVTVIKYYQRHGTHEQFHSEIKTDLDLERLPSGKFDSNDAILHLAMFAYNCLRLLGQLGLTGKISPVRHPAKRRRLKTVLQEIMHRAAKYVEHARYHSLDFGCTATIHTGIIAALQDRLWKAGST